MPQASAVNVEGLHDPATGAMTYVVWDSESRAAAVIDPVLDYEPRTSRTANSRLQAVVQTLEQHALQLRWILETHIHADHLSGAARLRAMRGGTVCIGSGIKEVRAQWSRFFPELERPDHRAFDRLLDDGARLELGSREITVMHTPGHTPACVTYVVDGMAFVGDAVFMPDIGTGRCDFPGGSASRLFHSIRKIFDLPPSTTLFTAHDYGRPDGGEVAWASTVEEQRRNNVHIRDAVSEADYVQLRTSRDHSLAPPALMWAAVQVNLRGGQLPDPAENGISYLRAPLDVTLSE